MRLVSRYAPSALAVFAVLTIFGSNQWAASVLSFVLLPTTRRLSSTTSLFGKKNKRKGVGGGGGGGGGGNAKRQQQQYQEKQSVRDARFDAATRQFMFTLTGLSKILPDKSKKILDDINLSFYPGAKVSL